MEPVIKQRIIRKNKRVGMFAAYRIGDNVAVGFSLCNPIDTYNHEMASKICYSRATSDKGIIVPNSLAYDYDKFIDRCERYFKIHLRDN